MSEKTEIWNFAVVACDLADCPRYLGFTETYEEAVKLQKEKAAVGWQRVAIFDATYERANRGHHKAVEE